MGNSPSPSEVSWVHSEAKVTKPKPLERPVWGSCHGLNGRRSPGMFELDFANGSLTNHYNRKEGMNRG